VSALHYALELIRTRGVDPTALQTHYFALEDAVDAFTVAESRPSGFIKAVVRP
jgi:threonine dehydrogenase-like Zn-dependent dehydrogenase